MSRSGGIVYHLRSLLHGKKGSNALWADHRAGVEKFLMLWNPPEKKLILIGPSGGYSLPKNFLDRFDEIIAFEPDPLARLIFEKRFQLKPRWITEAVQFHQLDTFSKLIPVGSAVLFSNLLGQLYFKRSSEVQKNLAKILAPFSWASYHDALSGENLEFDTELAETGRKATLSQMKSWIYPKIKGGTLEVNAHQAPDLFAPQSEVKFYYWQWRIHPKRTHLIEGVFHVKT